MAEYLQVRSNGQITLPAAARRKANLNEGDLLEVVIEQDGSIRLLPKTAVDRSLAEKYQLKDVVWALKHRVSRWRAQLAVRSIRSQAHKDGLDTMTEQDIDALIKKTRASRRR